MHLFLENLLFFIQSEIVDYERYNLVTKQVHFDWIQKVFDLLEIMRGIHFTRYQNGKYVSSINLCRDASKMCAQCIKFRSQPRSPFFKI